jgi:hypothetical protein
VRISKKPQKKFFKSYWMGRRVAVCPKTYLQRFTVFNEGTAKMGRTISLLHEGGEPISPQLLAHTFFPNALEIGILAANPVVTAQ